MCVPPFKYSDFKQIFHINQNCRIVCKLKYKLNTKSESPLSTSTSLVESGLSAWSSCPGVCAQQPLCGVWLQGCEERVSLALQPIQPCLLLMPHADPGHCLHSLALRMFIWYFSSPATLEDGSTNSVFQICHDTVLFQYWRRDTNACSSSHLIQHWVLIQIY